MGNHITSILSCTYAAEDARTFMPLFIIIYHALLSPGPTLSVEEYTYLLPSTPTPRLTVM